MKVCFILWGTSLTGGNRAIFEVTNRLSRRGYHVEAMALGGDRGWFKVEIPIHCVTPLRTLATLIRILMRIYRVLRLRTRPWKQLGMLAVGLHCGDVWASR